ncbi:MAG: hypothetical protein VYA17_02850, partial [Pseudomonadota bacterium]|nr:hypothetical protein [Pseudomonadota bacterium]
DVAMLDNQKVDRGGCINLIAPTVQEKYPEGEEITVPEMNITGFLVEVAKIEPSRVKPVGKVSFGDPAAGVV